MFSGFLADSQNHRWCISTGTTAGWLMGAQIHHRADTIGTTLDTRRAVRVGAIRKFFVAASFSSDGATEHPWHYPRGSKPRRAHGLLVAVLSPRLSVRRPAPFDQLPSEAVRARRISAAGTFPYPRTDLKSSRWLDADHHLAALSTDQQWWSPQATTTALAMIAPVVLTPRTWWSRVNVATWIFRRRISRWWILRRIDWWKFTRHRWRLLPSQPHASRWFAQARQQARPEILCDDPIPPTIG